MNRGEFIDHLCVSSGCVVVRVDKKGYSVISLLANPWTINPITQLYKSTQGPICDNTYQNHVVFTPRKVNNVNKVELQARIKE